MDLITKFIYGPKKIYNPVLDLYFMTGNDGVGNCVKTYDKNFNFVDNFYVDDIKNIFSSNGNDDYIICIVEAKEEEKRFVIEGKYFIYVLDKKTKQVITKIEILKSFYNSVSVFNTSKFIINKDNLIIFNNGKVVYDIQGNEIVKIEDNKFIVENKVVKEIEKNCNIKFVDCNENYLFIRDRYTIYQFDLKTKTFINQFKELSKDFKVFDNYLIFYFEDKKIKIIDITTNKTIVEKDFGNFNFIPKEYELKIEMFKIIDDKQLFFVNSKFVIDDKVIEEKEKNEYFNYIKPYLIDNYYTRDTYPEEKFIFELYDLKNIKNNKLYFFDNFKDKQIFIFDFINKSLINSKTLVKYLYETKIAYLDEKILWIDEIGNKKVLKEWNFITNEEKEVLEGEKIFIYKDYIFIQNNVGSLVCETLIYDLEYKQLVLLNGVEIDSYLYSYSDVEKSVLVNNGVIFVLYYNELFVVDTINNSSKKIDLKSENYSILKTSWNNNYLILYNNSSKSYKFLDVKKGKLKRKTLKETEFEKNEIEILDDNRVLVVENDIIKVLDIDSLKSIKKLYDIKVYNFLGLVGENEIKISAYSKDFVLNIDTLEQKEIDENYHYENFTIVKESSDKPILIIDNKINQKVKLFVEKNNWFFYDIDKLEIVSQKGDKNGNK